MPSDIREVLESAAAQPGRHFDMNSTWRRGMRLRWTRRIAATSAVAVIVIGAYVSVDVLNGGNGLAPELLPAATPKGELCEEVDEHEANAVAVFLRDDAKDAAIGDLVEEVSAMPGVAGVEYWSKADAFEEFKEVFKDQPEYWESLPRDALPASLRVRLEEGVDDEEVAAQIPYSPIVDDVDYSGELFERAKEYCASFGDGD